MNGLQVRDLVVVRAGRRLLDGVDLSVPPGAMVAVTGASGAGKTTLLHVLAGLVAPDEGAVSWDGEDATTLRSTRAAALIPQTYGLASVLSAAENVELVLAAAGWHRAEIGPAARRALARVGLVDNVDRLVEELSGGQQQRVAVARALAPQTPLLLADEPTTELDDATRDLVLAALRERAAAGAAVVLATHDPAAAATCDTELHLVDGRPVRERLHLDDELGSPAP